MLPPNSQNYRFRLNLKGRENGKRRFLVKPGMYSEIISPAYEFEFNLRGQIKSIRGLTPDWPHPLEFLKRSEGNDWVYYTVGKDSSDRGIASWFGEYYLPCLPYPSNTFWTDNPFSKPAVMTGIASWSQLYGDLYGMQFKRSPPSQKTFIDLVLANDENKLHQQAVSLNRIIGERVSVLPPDARHVDYETIPLIIADGCLYHCGFCSVKSQTGFHTRSKTGIVEEISLLKRHYGPDLAHINAVFLGNHDALAAEPDVILQAITMSIESFQLTENKGRRPYIFLFGSVDSFLRTEEGFLNALNALPVSTFINLGFESVDNQTLKQIRKPLEASKVTEAFHKMLQINQDYSAISVTGNFLIGDMLPEEHEASLCRLLSQIPASGTKKGAVYLSPLMGKKDNQHGILNRFRRIQSCSRMPVYIYLIQRI